MPVGIVATDNENSMPIATLLERLWICTNGIPVPADHNPYNAEFGNACMSDYIILSADNGRKKGWFHLHAGSIIRESGDRTRS